MRGKRVNLRAGPSPDAEVLGLLTANLPLFVERDEGGWSLVRTANGHVGFVRTDLLKQR